MSSFTILEEDFIQLPEIIKRIHYCFRNKIGFALVRIGDAENQVLAQGSIYKNEEIKNIWWAENENWTGVVLPNYEARDIVIESVRKADIVGVLHQSEEFEWRNLTEAVFSIYDIKPRQLCYAFINTYMINNPDLIALMENHRVLLIGKAAPAFAYLLKTRFNINVSGAIIINNYFEIPGVLEEASHFDYEMVLISAGSNAVILASALAQQGKIAIDFGSAMNNNLWHFPLRQTIIESNSHNKSISARNYKITNAFQFKNGSNELK